VHYQTKVWLNAMVSCPQLLPIEEFGWYMDEKGEVLPVFNNIASTSREINSFNFLLVQKR
jgi:hypothetical protein